ncbi:MAG: hypothetical protein ACTHN0_11650, partial [Aquihabitans sp.]
MTSRRGSLLVASRLARREVRRHPWRHLLVTVLIFLPVFTALAAFSTVSTWHAYEQHRTDFTHPSDGGLEYCCPETDAEGKPALSALDGLIDAARTETWRQTGDWLITDMARPDGRGPKLAGAEVTEASPGSAASPRFLVDAGRLPKERGEIFLTTPLADQGGWHLGDTVRSVRAGEELQVVGIGRLGHDVERPAAAVTGQPAAFWSAQTAGGSGIPAANLADGSTALTETWSTLVVHPVDDAHRAAVVAVIGGSSQTDQVDGRIGPGLTLGAAAICAVVAVVASAAFAIASRRQLRSVGLLSTVGTDPATIRAAMVLQGALPG